MSDSRGTPRRHVLQIGVDESLPEVLTRLRAHAGRTVELDIPDHSPILLTATEFRTLRDAANRSQIALSIRTEDRLRVQLASMFDLMEGVTIARRGKDASSGRGDLAQPVGAWTAGAAKDDDDPIAVSRRRRQVMERSRLDEPGATSGKRSRKGDDDAGSSLDYLDGERRTGLSARAWGRIVAVVLVLVLIAGVAAWYAMPAVSVEATLNEGQVSGELTFAVGLADAQLPSNVQYRIEAQEATADVAITLSVPATGGEVRPDGTATGIVDLRNPTDAAIDVPAGTAMRNALGVRFTTTEDVQVPAASGDTPGEATVAITAEEPGTGSNVAQGAFTGKVENLDIYFSNRSAPIEGGTDTQILEVTEDDIATLEQTLSDQLASVVATSWVEQLPEGTTLVRPSVSPGEPDYEIDQQVGDVSDVVSLTGTVQATGLTYTQADIEEELRNQFRDQLNQTVPEGFGLLSNTITLGELEVVSEYPSAVIYRQSATATTQAIFDEGARDALREEMAGKSYDEALAIVQAQPAFASVEVTRSPSFWPERMPRSPERITLEILPGSESLPAASPSPQAGT
jgi:hypothetical protein